jgi:hypothetical protein
MLRRSFGETLVTPFRVEPPPATAQSLHRTSEKKTQQGKFSLEISTEIPEHASCDDLDWSAIILQCQSLKEKPYHCSQTFCISSAPDHDIQIEVINIQAIANSPCRGRLGCTVPGRRRCGSVTPGPGCILRLPVQLLVLLEDPRRDHRLSLRDTGPARHGRRTA